MTAIARAATSARRRADHRSVAAWDALGTYVRVVVADPAARDDVAALVADVLAEVDATYSRFRADSQLRRLPAGRSVPVSPLLAGAVRVALDAADQTGGLLDPTTGGVLRAAGYDRTYRALADDPSPVTLPAPSVGRWRDVRLDDNPGEADRPAYLFVPHGVLLDLGATGKAYAADVAAGTVAARLRVPALISVGGDVAVASPRGSRRTPWTVTVATSLDEAELGGQRVRLTGGGLATSSTTTRRWNRAGGTWHHLIDPRTNRPAQSPWATVSAAGRSCVAANVATAWAILLGADAPATLAAHGVAARLIDHHGLVTLTPGWPERTNPKLTNPKLTNAELTNPELTNPERTNPELTNKEANPA